MRSRRRAVTTRPLSKSGRDCASGALVVSDIINRGQRIWSQIYHNSRLGSMAPDTKKGTNIQHEIKSTNTEGL